MDYENLYGLVLCGGNSSRMGVDKSTLNYHGIEQRFHLYQFLKQFCKCTFVSHSKSQLPLINPGYQSIVDEDYYAGNGPLSGLLTAFDRFPSMDILAVGCDYPFIDAREISNFLSTIPKYAIAAAFFHQQSKFYEPVLAWYSHQAGERLKNYFQGGNSSPQEFLRILDAYRYSPLNSAAHRSIDTFEQFAQAVEQLRSKS